MGGEWGQIGEWACKGHLEWDRLSDPLHADLHEFIKELNHFYLRTPALWERDFEKETLEWVVECDREKGVVIYNRKGIDKKVLCIHNFSNHEAVNYTFSCSQRPIALLLTTEKTFSRQVSFDAGKVTLTIPPFTTLVFEVAT